VILRSEELIGAEVTRARRLCRPPQERLQIVLADDEESPAKPMRGCPNRQTMPIWHGQPTQQ
jgi:hypothetical protein